nr:phospholipase-like protein [Tanacetum cinerariifolium]
MSSLSQFALACNSIMLKEVLAVMFENDTYHDFNLVMDMHTKLNDLGMRITQRAELILDVEQQGYSAEIFEFVKLLKVLQETDNAKARVSSHKLGLKVTNLDLLGLIEDEELFGKLVDDDAIRVCLLLAIEDSSVNLDLTPTISEQQTVWYMAFRKFFMSYIPRTPPTTYTDLFDDYIKKLSASRKRGKIDTRDLPIIRRFLVVNKRAYLCSGCWEELNEEFNELHETNLFFNGPDYLIQEESRLKQEEEEMCHLEEHKMMEALFLKTLQQEENTFAMAEKDRPLNSLNDQDMNIFLKDVTTCVEDLSRYNRETDRVHLSDGFDIFLGQQGPLRCSFPW